MKKGTAMRKQQFLTVLALAGWAVACSSAVVWAGDCHLDETQTSLRIFNLTPSQLCRITLSRNLRKSVDIWSSNVYLNCDGASITNPQREDLGAFRVPYGSSGIDVLNSSNVTISKCHISGFTAGIVFDGSPNGQVVGSELHNNSTGLVVIGRSAPSQILYNRIHDNFYNGLWVSNSPGDITITGNIIQDNDTVLDCLDHSGPIRLVSNLFQDNGTNLVSDPTCPYPDYRGNLWR
jgi:parallel beta-helix repeat protein